MRYQITPCPKPRMTQRDKWAKRPCVVKYFAFCDEVRDKIKEPIVSQNGTLHVIFYIPMPPSWSKRKKEELDTMPHKQKPDTDNLVKALLDAAFKDDSHVWRLVVEKRWSRTGAIEILL